MSARCVSHNIDISFDFPDCDNALLAVVSADILPLEDVAIEDSGCMCEVKPALCKVLVAFCLVPFKDETLLARCHVTSILRVLRIRL
jgi:hypothetical protein